MAELNLILLGPPGAGKGTQAERIREEFGLAHIATGDILREAVRNGSELGTEARRYMDAGDLVPDDVIIGIIVERLQEDDARDGFLLDGFPRTVVQAQALEETLDEHGRSVTAALCIQVPDEEIVRRVSGRRVSAKTGRVYHVEFNPPAVDGKCDEDGSELIQREDDEPDTVRNRLRVYHEMTAPVEQYYEERGLLHRIDGTASPTEVHDHVRGAIATLRLEADF
jgi:adenylate kinase